MASKQRHKPALTGVLPKAGVDRVRDVIGLRGRRRGPHAVPKVDPDARCGDSLKPHASSKQGRRCDGRSGGYRKELLTSTAEEIRRGGIDVFSSCCDVSGRVQVDRFIDSVTEKYEHVDILVNNSAVCRANPIDDPEDDTWRRVLAANLDGVFYGTRRALRSMPDGGRVISIAAISGKTGDAGYTAYCASKHAVIGFTRALTLEVASRRITVNAVCPGWTNTEMARQDLETGAQPAFP